MKHRALLFLLAAPKQAGAQVPATPVVASSTAITVGPATSKGKTPKGQEFLGVGYNVLTGNPRGDLSSNFDPGFGLSVLALPRSDRKVRGLAEPVIAFIKGTKVCSFSSEAKTISSVNDMQSTLNKESSDDVSASLGVSTSGASFDSSNSFSKSEKMNKFKQEKESENTVSFEASAKCIDFRMTIDPYFNETASLAKGFLTAIENIKTALNDATYDSALHRKEFAKFFKTYGTHYITEIDMGGKYVISSDMSSKDVSSLTTEKVDIASTLSFSASFSFLKEEDDSGKKAATTLDAKRDYYKPTCCGNNMTTPPPAPDGLFDDKPPPPAPDPATGLIKKAGDMAPFSISASVQSTHKRSTSRSSTDSVSVKSKITKQSTYTLGGLPPTNGNWATWAASVEGNPMPVAYKYAPIWELAAFVNIKEAYFAAAFDLYKRHLLGTTPSGEPAFRHGVISASGQSVSRYSASSDRRKNIDLSLELSSVTVLALTAVPVYVNQEETQDVANIWSSFATATEVEEGFFACGLRAKIDPEHKTLVHLNARGLTGLDVRFCSIEKWSNQENVKVYHETSGWLQPWKICPFGQYIVQIKPSVHVGDLGIESLEIKCATMDGAGDDAFHDIVPSWPYWAKRIGTAEAVKPDQVIAGQLIRSIRVQNEEGSWKGIKGMEVSIAHADTSQTYGGPPSPIYYYRSYWDLRTSGVSPIFATPIRGKIGKSAAESKQLSFTSKRGALAVESLSLYTYMDEASRPKLAVTDFKSDIKEADLQPFSMLVSNHLSEDAKKVFGLQGGFLSGVVHPDAYGMSSSKEINYEVEYEDDEKPNIATLILKGLQSSHVSLLVTPVWFPTAGTGKYPTNAGDVAVATSKCISGTSEPSEWRCHVQLGSEGNSKAADHLGFSFMVLGHNTTSTATQRIGCHGTVIVKESENDYGVTLDSNETSAGVTVHMAFNETKDSNVLVGEGDLAQINVKKQVTGGIKLMFDPPFEDIPAIIVSPIINHTETSLSRYATDILSLPSVIVEHVTAKEALIRVGMVDTYQTGVKAKIENSCASISNVHQTFTVSFRAPGTIQIDGKCFTRNAVNSFVDAGDCSPTAEDQWVYDGTRIRSAEDPSKCIWASGQNDRLKLHTCLSDDSLADDERFNFFKHSSAYTSLETMYSRCVYKSGTQFLLSTSNDSRCHDGQDADWSGITITNSFATHGFLIKASEKQANEPVKFDQCLSWLSSKNEFNPLSSCLSTDTDSKSAFILSMDVNDANDKTYKLKLADGDWPDGKLSNEVDVNALYLGKVSASGDLVMSTLSTSTTSFLDVDFQVIFEQYTKVQKTQLTASRLKINGINECVAWDRSLNGAEEYDVEALFTPASFSFAAIGPVKHVSAPE